MPQAKKYDREGNQIEDIELPADLFVDKINKAVVHKVVNTQLASIRSGNASTKTRSEVRGGGRKPWRQKGTGRARHGSIRSPLWVGGGITFGPKPRSFDKKVMKKEKKLALRSILTDKASTDSILILDELQFPEPKTRQVIDLLDNLDLNNKKVLILLANKDENIYLSARNVPGVKTLVIAALNAYDLLDNDYIIMTEDVLPELEEVLIQ